MRRAGLWTTEWGKLMASYISVSCIDEGGQMAGHEKRSNWSRAEVPIPIMLSVALVARVLRYNMLIEMLPGV